MPQLDMGEALANENLQIRSAEEAADQLFNARNGDTVPYCEPNDLPAAEAAVRRLGKRFNEAPRSHSGGTGRRSGQRRPAFERQAPRCIRDYPERGRCRRLAGSARP